MELINKSALVAEIKRRIKGLKECHADTVAAYSGEISGLKRLLSFLNTLEVKEVDLEKEVELWMESNVDDSGYFNTLEFAKHFFELGVQQSKNDNNNEEKK